jgi:hypothetical protein
MNICKLQQFVKSFITLDPDLACQPPEPPPWMTARATTLRQGQLQGPNVIKLFATVIYEFL